MSKQRVRIQVCRGGLRAGMHECIVPISFEDGSHGWPWRVVVGAVASCVFAVKRGVE